MLFFPSLPWLGWNILRRMLFVPVSNCSCSANCRWSTYQYNGFVSFNSAKLIDRMESLSSSGCSAIVKNQFLWKTSIFFIPTNFLCSWSCKNGPLAIQPSGPQQGVLIPLGVHNPFWSDAWPARAQESLALTIHRKVHLGPCALHHSLLTCDSSCPALKEPLTFLSLFSSCHILAETALKGTKQTECCNTCSLSHAF